jgi:hypothetical protein
VTASPFGCILAQAQEGGHIQSAALRGCKPLEETNSLLGIVAGAGRDTKPRGISFALMAPPTLLGQAIRDNPGKQL